MPLPFSTRVDDSLGVAPVRWDGRVGGGVAVIEAKGWEPLGQDATMALCEEDLLEARAPGFGGDDTLRGPLFEGDSEPLELDTLPLAQLSRWLRAVPPGVAGLFDEERTSPLKLAALSFGAGVGMTLLGVVLAL